MPGPAEPDGLLGRRLIVIGIAVAAMLSAVVGTLLLWIEWTAERADLGEYRSAATGMIVATSVVVALAVGIVGVYTGPLGIARRHGADRRARLVTETALPLILLVVLCVGARFFDPIDDEFRKMNGWLIRPGWVDAADMATVSWMFGLRRNGIHRRPGSESPIHRSQ